MVNEPSYRLGERWDYRCRDCKNAYKRPVKYSNMRCHLFADGTVNARYTCDKVQIRRSGFYGGILPLPERPLESYITPEKV